MLQTASFTGFVRTIFILVLIYYGLKFLMRILAPFMVQYMSKKMQEQFGGQFQQQKPNQNFQKEGETVIDKMPNQQKSSDKSVGEYIDYEEID